MGWLGLRAQTRVVAMATMLIGAGAPIASYAIEIVLKDVAPDRIERQRRNAEGQLPLPGTPNLAAIDERLASKGLTRGSDVFIRMFKAESQLELWMRKGDRFVLLDVYPICHWSGSLGPKILEGDKQNPEGFYRISLRQLHLIGRWPRSFNVGYPNSYDRALGRTGSYILLHGGCSSVGCFAMTNEVMSEIYDLTEKALRSGQEEIDVHIFPFRMTKANLERYAGSAWIDFWRNLKEGYDAFEATQIPPEIGVCNKKYVVHEVAPGDAAADKRIPGSNGNRRNASRDFECASKTAAVTEQDAGEGADASASRGVALKRLSHRSPAVASEASGETQPTSKQ